MAKNEEIIAVVPAQPGFELYYICDRELCLTPHPVVAFVVVKCKRHDGSFFLMNNPLTAESDGHIDEDAQDHCLKRPDGSFDFPFECTFASKAEAEAYVAQGKLRGVTLVGSPNKLVPHHGS